MNEIIPPLSLVIVSDDPFARELLSSAARDSHGFEAILAIDGANAFARTMHEVVAGKAPNVFVLDRHSLGANADRFALELRTQPATRRAFVASLLPAEIRAIPEVDFHEASPPGKVAHAELMRLIARRATAAFPLRRAA